jgi:hypothetical protein
MTVPDKKVHFISKEDEMIEPSQKTKDRKPLTEDWLAVIIAFILIILTVLGALGTNGIPVTF